MNIKRYDVGEDSYGQTEWEVNDGDWVKYEDVKYLIKREETRKALLICKENEVCVES